MPVDTPVPFSNPPLSVTPPEQESSAEAPSAATEPGPAEAVPESEATVPTEEPPVVDSTSAEAPAVVDEGAPAPEAEVAPEAAPEFAAEPEPSPAPVEEIAPESVPEPAPVDPPSYSPPAYAAPVSRPAPVAPPASGNIPPPTPPPTIKADKWLVAVVVLVAVMAVVFGGIHFLFKANPKPKETARPVSTKTEAKAPVAPNKSAAPAEPHLVDNPQSDLGKAVARARDAVAAHEKQGEGVEAVIDSQKTAKVEKPASSSAKPGPAVAKPTAKAVPVAAPSDEEEPEQPAPPPPPSDEFRQFITVMKVNGVFQGENARAMLNGKLYVIGDVVEPKLKITFIKVDPETKLLTFQEGTGATLTRRY